MDRRTNPFRITVATLTRQRPEMLDALIRSWGEMALPQNTTVRCLVVENDTVARSEAVIQARGPALLNGVPLDYVLETEPGIPFGRNRAAHEAIAKSADLLCFVDDDEVVAPDWLEKLVEGYRTSAAVLLGAPLRAGRPTGSETVLQRLMLENVSNRYLGKERNAARRASLNDTGGVTIVTNNWLGETSLFSEHNIWFDEKMRMTGGTDAKFYAETVAAGLPVGWVEDAFVYETIPPDRLSFWYQVARGRDQSNAHLRRRLSASPLKALLGFFSVPLRLLALLLTAALFPFQPKHRYIQIARQTGWLIGVLGIFVGYKSALYKKVTGH